jgi:hypothetical protein
MMGIMFALVVFGCMAQGSSTEPSSLTIAISTRGTVHGRGDVMGPWNLALDLKRTYPQHTYVVVVDKRSQLILTECLLHASSQEHASGAREGDVQTPLEQLTHRYGIRLISEDRHQDMPKVDINFESYFGARSVGDVKRINYLQSGAIQILMDPMHGLPVGEIILPGNIHLKMRSFGIGGKRWGMPEDVWALTLNALSFEERLQLLEQKLEGLLQHHQNQVKNLIFLVNHIRKGGLFTVAYGLHNEAIAMSEEDRERMTALWRKHEKNQAPLTSPQKRGSRTIERSPLFDDQFEQFVRGLKHLQANSKNPEICGVLLTAVSEEDLKLLLKPETLDEKTLCIHLENGASFTPRIFIKNELIIIRTDGLTSELFTLFQSLSNAPLLIEGNASVATALQLQKPFALIRSPWNQEQIKDIAYLFKQKAHYSGYLDRYIHPGELRHSSRKGSVENVHFQTPPDVTNMVLSQELTPDIVRKSLASIPSFAPSFKQRMDFAKEISPLFSSSLSQEERASRLLEKLESTDQHKMDDLLLFSALKAFRDQKLLTHSQWEDMVSYLKNKDMDLHHEELIQLNQLSLARNHHFEKIVEDRRKKEGKGDPFIQKSF